MDSPHYYVFPNTNYNIWFNSLILQIFTLYVQLSLWEDEENICEGVRSINIDLQIYYTIKDLDLADTYDMKKTRGYSESLQ